MELIDVILLLLAWANLHLAIELWARKEWFMFFNSLSIIFLAVLMIASGAGVLR